MSLHTHNDGYWARLGVSVSILVAAAFGAEMYETVCAAAWRNRDHHNLFVWWCAQATIRATDLVEPNHCKTSAWLHARLVGKKHPDLINKEWLS